MERSATAAAEWLARVRGLRVEPAGVAARLDAAARNGRNRGRWFLWCREP